MAIKKVYELTADLKQTTTRSSVPVLVQGDSAEFRIRLLDNGAELSTEQLTGITKVSMQSGYDAQTVIQTVGTLQGSVAVFRLKKNELFRSGTVQAMVQLEDTEDRISTLRFQYQVIPDLAGNYIPGEQDITVFQRYMNDAQVKIDEINAAAEVMAATDVAQLTVKLEDTVLNTFQTDLVAKVNRMRQYDSVYYMRRSGTEDISVIFKINDDLIVWEMLSNIYDDFKQLGECYHAKAKPPEKFKQASAYTPVSGTVMDSAAPYKWMQTIGGKIAKTFTGTGIDFRHLKDSRGGVWRFTINTNPVQTIDVETFNHTMIEGALRPLFRNLPPNTYTITGEFIGAGLTTDPTPRGWIDAVNTFDIYEEDASASQFRVEKVATLLNGPSNKELAMQFAPTGSGLPGRYTPMHTAHATTFNRTPMQVFADEVLLTNTTNTLESNKVYPCEEISFLQKMRVRHTGHNADSLNFDIVHTFRKDGNVEVNGKLNILENLDIIELFMFMLPGSTEHVRRVLSGKGNEYQAAATDGSITDTSGKEGRSTLSYAFLSHNNDYVMAGRVNDQAETMALKYPFNNALYRESWIQHRGFDLQKIYTYAMRGSKLFAGDVIRFSTTFTCARINSVDKLL